jgi:SAM-dependent methyltransferase
MERVTGSRESGPFIVDGLTIAHTLVTTADQFASLRCRWFDYGCGCGRISVPLSRLLPAGASVTGADIDAEAVSNLNDRQPEIAAMALGQDEDPPVPDGSADIVISISLATHLDAQAQRLWLARCRRILVPGGLLLATVQGEHAAALRPLSTLERMALESDGICSLAVDPALTGVVGDPSAYRRTFQTSAYTRQAWREGFELLDYQPAVISGMQDLVIMSRIP